VRRSTEGVGGADGESAGSVGEGAGEVEEE
jgi:hypothetical protein